MIIRWILSLLRNFPPHFHNYSAKPKQENLNELKQELDIDFHKVAIGDLFQRLGTNAETGLTAAQVKHNQVKAVCWQQLSYYPYPSKALVFKYSSWKELPTFYLSFDETRLWSQMHNNSSHESLKCNRNELCWKVEYKMSLDNHCKN